MKHAPQRQRGRPSQTFEPRRVSSLASDILTALAVRYALALLHYLSAPLFRRVRFASITPLCVVHLSIAGLAPCVSHSSYVQDKAGRTQRAGW